MKNRIAVMLIMIITVIQTACGFHLRQPTPLAAPLQRIYIQSSDPYSQLTQNLQQSLESSGAKVVVSPDLASTILIIQREETGQQLLSVGGTQQTRQYNLILSVDFAVTDTVGRIILPSQTVTETSAITIQASQILAGSNEANNIYQKMRRAITLDIMLRLSSKAATEKLLKSPTTQLRPAT
jgi:LPS-assembly lipoprotein